MLFFNLVLILIVNINCLIHDEYEYYDDYKLALGYQHVSYHLNNKDIFLSSIDHIKTIISNNNINNNNIKNNYVGCTYYDQIKTLLEKIYQYNFKLYTTYSSLSNNRYCFVIYLNINEYNFLVESKDILMLFLKPIPTILKIDYSIIKVLEWLYSFNEQLTDEQFKMIEKSHPIIKNIIDNKNIEISMIYRELNSERNQNETGHYILNDVFQKMLKNEKNNIFETFFWTSSHSTKIQNIWFKKKFYQEDLNCNSDIFETYHHNRNIRLKISQNFLKDYKKSYQSISSCLTYLVIAITSDHTISRLAIDRPLHLLNNNAKMITQSASPLSTSDFESYSLNGLNQIIGVCDTGIDMNSCFFRDEVYGHTKTSTIEKPRTYNYYRKVVQYVNYSGSSGDIADGHGSHVAGSVAGNCIASDSTYNSNKVFNGMAPLAKIAFFDIGVNNKDHDLKIPFYLEDIYSATYTSGARIHTNSWGGSNWYDEYALETDKFLYENSDFVLLFAAGNDGSQGSHTVLTPGLTKNAISVGGSENNHEYSNNINSVATFSAQGPTPDGRIKPDIVAPSSYIISVASASENTDDMTCKTERKSGTSMSSPIAAGNAALIRQYMMGSSFWGKFCHPQYSFCTGYGIYPSGALIKAMLLHSCVPMSKYGQSDLFSLPDMQQGYGRISLNSLLPLNTYERLGYTLFVDEQSLPSFSEVIYDVNVTDTNHPFKVTLSWYDPPNTEFAAKFLLHDLDLVVFDPNGQSFYGNTGLSLDGRKILGSQRDELNNNEQVWIDANAPPLPGLYRVHVQSKLLTESKYQNFSIVITAGGLVYEPNNIVSLNSSIFHECAYGGLIINPPQTEIEVSKFIYSMNTKDFYTISEKNVVLSKGFFASKYKYDYDKVCLHKGCYQASLEVTTNSFEGSQLTIPDCNIYLAPSFKSQSFCIDEYYNSYRTRKFSCMSECNIDSHILLPIILIDLVGESWKGIYYSIESLDINENNSSRSITAGSLQWGYEDFRQVCLPASNSTLYSAIKHLNSESICYKLSLLIPSILPEVEPFLTFDNIISYADNKGNIKAAKECPYMLSLNMTMSTICINEKLLLGNASFYSIENSNPIIKGTCTFNVEFKSGISINSFSMNSTKDTISPTISPTQFYSFIPTNVPSYIPSYIPTFTPSQTELPTAHNNTMSENILKNNNNAPTITQVVLSLGFEALFLLMIFLFIKKLYSRKYNRIKNINTLTVVNNSNSNNASNTKSTRDDFDEKDNYNYEMITMKVDDYEDINIEKIIDHNIIAKNPLHEEEII